MPVPEPEAGYRNVEIERKELASLRAENARLAALQGLTSRLAALQVPSEVAELVLGQGVAELGATTASLCLLSQDDLHLEVAASAGYPGDVTQRWARFRLDAPTPAGDAVRCGVGIYTSSLDELAERYPIFAGEPVVGDEATAVLPLVADTTGPLGAMVLGFAEPRSFSAADRRMLEALAAQAAVALARTRSRVELDVVREQLAYLSDASTRLAASLDLDETLATVAELAVPRLADRCGVFLLVDGRVEARMWAPAEAHIDLDVVSRRPVSLDDAYGVGAVLRSGRSVFVPELDDARLASVATSPHHHRLLRQIGFGAGAIMVMRARGQLVGALVLANRAGHTMAERDRALAEELGSRAAVAIDNAQLFAAQALVARRLQSSLLPMSLPAIAGLELAARYTPAGRGTEVGGDFYDCIPVGEGRWLLVVGDVKGKGIDAAALTGMARHTIRAVATTEGGPAAVLSRFNDILFRYEAERTASDESWVAAEPRFCTVVAVSLARHEHGFKATVASAAHPLPILRGPDGEVRVVGKPAGLVGIKAQLHPEEVEVDLPPGSLLVCYTDGLSECHDGPRFLGDTGVLRAVSTANGPAASAVADMEATARSFASGGTIRDDMAILVVRVLDDADPDYIRGERSTPERAMDAPVATRVDDVQGA